MLMTFVIVVIALIGVVAFLIIFIKMSSSESAEYNKKAGGGEAPFLVDFTEGRVGSFLGTKKSNLNPDCVDIIYAPLGLRGMTQTKVIKNIPKAEDGGYALIETPGLGKNDFCFVLTDNNGNAPIAEQLDLIDTELTEKLRDFRERAELDKAASRELKKLESGSIADQLREAGKIGSSLSGSSDEDKTRKRRRSSLMGSRREEA